MVVKILMGAVIVVLLVLVFAATKPSTFHVEKSITTKASPEKVYALIADFHNWPEWAAQDREDATMLRTFTGAASGLGAVSDWTSRGSAGAGRMTITGATAPSRIDVAVDWKRPFRVRNTHEFAIVHTGDLTKVTWTAEGSNLYIMKLMEVFVGVNGVMGKHFEAGLKGLKTVAEQ